MSYTKYFKRGQRAATETVYYFLADNAPDHLENLVSEIHDLAVFDCLPNDWIYWTIKEAIGELENDSLEDINIEADSYESELMEWLQNRFAKEFCTEALTYGEFKDFTDLVSQAQRDAKSVIYGFVSEYLETVDEEE